MIQLTGTHITVKGNVAKYVKTISRVQISGEFYKALEREVIDLVDRAISRAEENSRSTLMARDL